MADEGYKTTTIYQIRIAFYNIFEFARENDALLITNPCKKSLKSDMGKPSDKKRSSYDRRSEEVLRSCGWLQL